MIGGSSTLMEEEQYIIENVRFVSMQTVLEHGGLSNLLSTDVNAVLEDEDEEEDEDDIFNNCDDDENNVMMMMVTKRTDDDEHVKRFNAMQKLMETVLICGSPSQIHHHCSSTSSSNQLLKHVCNSDPAGALRKHILECLPNYIPRGHFRTLPSFSAGFSCVIVSIYPETDFGSGGSDQMLISSFQNALQHAADIGSTRYVIMDISCPVLCSSRTKICAKQALQNVILSRRLSLKQWPIKNVVFIHQ